MILGYSSVNSSTLPVEECNRIFFEVAPKTKKNRTFGFDSIDEVPIASSSQQHPPRPQADSEENARLRGELAESNARFTAVTDLFSIFAMDNESGGRDAAARISSYSASGHSSRASGFGGLGAQPGSRDQ
ncbi:unnamed protein product [Cochlearia groenlandica]